MIVITHLVFSSFLNPHPMLIQWISFLIALDRKESQLGKTSQSNTNFVSMLLYSNISISVLTCLFHSRCSYSDTYYSDQIITIVFPHLVIFPHSVILHVWTQSIYSARTKWITFISTRPIIKCLSRSAKFNVNL